MSRFPQRNSRSDPISPRLQLNRLEKLSSSSFPLPLSIILDSFLLHVCVYQKQLIARSEDAEQRRRTSSIYIVQSCAGVQNARELQSSSSFARSYLSKRYNFAREKLRPALSFHLPFRGREKLECQSFSINSPRHRLPSFLFCLPSRSEIKEAEMKVLPLHASPSACEEQHIFVVLRLLFAPPLLPPVTHRRST
jgi:hypothetical protein